MNKKSGSTVEVERSRKPGESGRKERLVLPDIQPAPRASLCLLEPRFNKLDARPSEPLAKKLSEKERRKEEGLKSLKVQKSPKPKTKKAGSSTQLKVPSLLNTNNQSPSQKKNMVFAIKSEKDNTKNLFVRGSGSHAESRDNTITIRRQEKGGQTPGESRFSLKTNNNRQVSSSSSTIAIAEDQKSPIGRFSKVDRIQVANKTANMRLKCSSVPPLGSPDGERRSPPPIREGLNELRPRSRPHGWSVERDDLSQHPPWHKDKFAEVESGLTPAWASGDEYQLDNLRHMVIEEADNMVEESDRDEFVEEREMLVRIKRSKKKTHVLSDLVPLNMQTEKERFYSMQCKYDPQFVYTAQKIVLKYNKPHNTFVKEARQILDAVLSKYGSDDSFFELQGPVVTREATEELFNKYVADLGLQGMLSIKFTDKAIAPTSVVHHEDGTATMIVGLPICYRENRLIDVLNHEIGTHYLRKFNDRKQVWFKSRQKFHLKDYLIIEEGLASINQTYEQAVHPKGTPYLFQAALHYYAAYLASFMGFQELYENLRKYISDPIKLWRECVRVKRGLQDTSKKGGMYKDQVYLRGCIDILRSRKRIDFQLLMCGKFNLKDFFRLRSSEQITRLDTKHPYFMADMKKYIKALDRIAEANFID